MRYLAGWILIGLLVAVSPAFAGTAVDGTAPLLCASIEALDCDPGDGCERGIPEEMGAPDFLRIDFTKKEIVGPARTTAIRSMEKGDEQIVLQGFEIGMGWTLALDRASGKMRIAFAGRDSTFIVFGACTTVP
jgi:hypothetical protein